MMHRPIVDTVKDLQHRWSVLHQQRQSILSRSEQYAYWTLPYVFPYTGETKNVEMSVVQDSIGARGVNHLANKIVMTLFPAQTVFFRLRVDAETRKLIKKAITESGVDENEADSQLQQAMEAVDTELYETEQQANEHLNMVAYRPQAVLAAKNLIITGNVLMYHPEKGPVQAYGLRNYCVQRDISGEVIEIMMCEEKAFETFRPEIQAQLRNPRYKDAVSTTYNDETNVKIYTQVRMQNDGKFHIAQCADHVLLDTHGYWPKDKLPWIVLAWNLIPGEDYGRGLVEEYAGAFHNLNVMNNSLLSLAAIMGDIKFLVNPASNIDVVEMNASPSGSYHSGKEGDVTTTQLQKTQDAQFIAAQIERYQQQINDAFLLSSTRNAERVTAEEIRMDAQELETSNGGIYSRLASTWQQPTANIVLDQIGFEGLNDGVVPQVITGMDSLSRQAELDNYRLFLGDLTLLENVPEDVRGRMKMGSYMSIIGKARQIDYKQIVMTDAEYKVVQDAQMQQQKALVQMQTDGKMQEQNNAAAIEGAA